MAHAATENLLELAGGLDSYAHSIAERLKEAIGDWPLEPEKVKDVQNYAQCIESDIKAVILCDPSLMTSSSARRILDALCWRFKNLTLTKILLPEEAISDHLLGELKQEMVERKQLPLAFCTVGPDDRDDYELATSPQMVRRYAGMTLLEQLDLYFSNASEIENQ